nr:TetR/AcrR family transcriptional regulator [uncultured Oscillibacter sp.]
MESVWREIFPHPEDEAVFHDTQAYITWMYEQMERGCRQYPGFFTLHSLGFLQEEKADGKRRMQQAWRHIIDGLLSVLKQDGRIRADAFTEQFTAERFSDVLFSLTLSALLRQDHDPAPVLEIVRRTLY